MPHTIAQIRVVHNNGKLNLHTSSVNVRYVKLLMALSTIPAQAGQIEMEDEREAGRGKQNKIKTKDCMISENDSLLSKTVQ